MDLVDGMSGRCLIGIPKKGRLYEKCIELLKKIDVQYVRKNRLDIALSTNMNICLLFLPAADIALYVGEGRVDLGITGQDVVAESRVQVKEGKKLGFGKCKLCVQAPKNELLTDPKMLVGKRIVTSFPHLAEDYFRTFDPTGSTHISTVSGSVEVGCALGLADAVIDLVESGETMKAAGLEIVDVVMETQAVLISNPRSPFQDLISKLERRIEGVILAERYVIVEFNVNRSCLAAVHAIVPGQKAPTVSQLDEPDQLAVKSMIMKTEAYDKMEQLEAAGATDIFITAMTNCRVSSEYNV